MMYNCFKKISDDLAKPTKKKCLLVTLVFVTLVFFVFMTYVLTNGSPIAFYSEGLRNKRLFTSRRAFNKFLNFTNEMHRQHVIKDTSITQNTLKYNKTNRELGKHHILWYKKPVWVHLDQYNSHHLKQCSYSNCLMSDNRTNISEFSAIVFTLTEGMEYPPPLTQSQRPKDQVWILFYLESSTNVRTYTKHMPNTWKSSINWTLTYRLDSDIKMPYGSMERKVNIVNRNYEQIFSRKTKFAAWIVSHCGAESGRDEYVYELRRYGIPVDVYGKCGKHGRKTNEELNKMLQMDYKFYLSFENSLCKDYVTEKFFENYNKDVIIVARGANYSRLFPQGTFIDTSQFDTIESLAKHLIAVNSSQKLFTQYMKNKDRYTALNLFTITTYSSCKLCEMLNHKTDNIKIHDDIIHYVHDPEYQCRKPTDVQIGFYHWELLICGVVLFVTLLLCICMYKCYGGKLNVYDNSER